MSDPDKISPELGRSASPTPAAGDPAVDLLGRLAAPAEARGPGRPQGAGNRRSDLLGKIIAHKHGTSPGELLAATAMHGLREWLDQGGAPGRYLELRAMGLAMQLGVDASWAFAQLVGMNRDLLPYVHQKLPLAVEVDQRSILFGVMLADGQAAKPGMGGLDLRPADVREAGKTQQNGSGSDAPGRTKAGEDQQ